MEATEAPAVDTPARVRVVVVDDVADVRDLLRLQFQVDGRFEVVGEGGDGFQAIELARVHQPDLIVLDRNMPRLGGLEAIEPIRAAAPDTAIVLYTAAGLDIRSHHQALAAGALDVMVKTAGAEFITQLTHNLLDRAAGDVAGVDIRVGPVSGEAARVWIANSTSIVDAVSQHRDLVSVPDDAIQLFQSLLGQWAEAAQGADEFVWVARADAADVAEIVEQWAVIDGMTDAQLESLGLHWSPPEGQPFFEALTEGVLRALARHDESQRLRARLVERWAPYRQGGTATVPGR
ncbi:MAG: response regulator [Actinobacteria bacterium]|nr:response regulator [Actinomycetota bacterium]